MFIAVEDTEVKGIVPALIFKIIVILGERHRHRTIYYSENKTNKLEVGLHWSRMKRLDLGDDLSWQRKDSRYLWKMPQR